MPENYGVDTVFVSFLIASSIKILPSLSKLMKNLTTFKANLYAINGVEGFNTTANRKIITSAVDNFEKKIELDNLAFSYENKEVLKKVSLSIKKGEVVGIVGDSGSGKTTLLHLLIGLVKPLSGKISIDGKLLSSNSESGLINLISYVPQSPLILEGSILENIALSSITDKNSLEKIKLLIKQFKLDDATVSYTHLTLPTIYSV